MIFLFMMFVATHTTAAPTLLWSLPAAPSHQFHYRPTVNGDVVFNGGDDLVAIYTSSGHLLWAVPDGPWLSPHVDNTTVFSVRNKSIVTALDRTTAQELWTYPSEGTINCAPALDAVSHTAIFAHGAPNTAVVALRSFDGTVAWTHSLGNATQLTCVIPDPHGR